MPRSPRKSRPLEQKTLEELALTYVARYATTRAKLVGYLARKLRERGWEDEREPGIEALADRFVELGYIDDAVFARSRTDGLLRRGYGVRRVGQALAAAGVGEEHRDEARPSEAAQREAAAALARKRGFGPYARLELDRDRREKQIAAMLRAGHVMDHVLQVIDAESEEALEVWIAEERDGQ